METTSSVGMSLDLTRHLALALSAQDVFGANRGMPQRGGFSERQLHALKRKVKLSQTPGLQFLPLLMKDAAVLDNIQRYAESDSVKALKIAVASKPKKKKDSKRRLKKSQLRKKELDRELVEKEAKRIEKEAQDNTPLPQPVKGKRRQSIASFLGTAPSINIAATSQGQGDKDKNGVSSVRIEVEKNDSIGEMNGVREEYLRDLFSFRKEQSTTKKQFTDLDISHNFCKNEVDGSRILLNYALERYELAKALDEGRMLEGDESPLDRDTYSTSRTDIQTEYKQKALEALQSFKSNRSEVERLHKHLIEESRIFYDKYCVPNALSRNEKKSASHRAPNEDGTISGLIELPRDYKIDSIDKLSENYHSSLNSLEISLQKERDSLYKKYDESKEIDRLTDELERYNNKVKSRDNNEVEELDIKLRKFDRICDAGKDQFYTTFIDAMTRSAQMSLEAVDQKFIEGTLEEADRSDLFDDLLWEMKERQWETQAFEDSRKRFCLGLVESLDSSIRDVNRKVTSYELERLERLNDKNLEF
jgi:hypothetical protein